MDIGMLKSNHEYYDGYEGDGEIIIRIKDAEEYYLSLWDGYFEDIFSKPILSNNAWTGFTRDYQEGKGIFDDDDSYVIHNLNEYIMDMKNYEGKKFNYAETKNCLDLMIAIFEFAKDNLMEIEVIVN